MATVNLKWNKPADCWMVDLLDDNGNALVLGFSLVTGADLLEQFKYLGIEGQIMAQTDHDSSAVPTYENLGSRGHMYFLTP